MHFEKDTKLPTYRMLLDCIPKTRFSDFRFSEILDLMNKLQLPFSYFTLFQTRFSEQRGSDNDVH